MEIKTTKVAGNVYLLEGQGGNIAVSAGPDGLLIVDDQFAPLADKIKAALDAIDQGDLQYVLNTHQHGDHTGGNPVFGLEALIVAHENVRKRLSTEQTVRGKKVPPMAPAGLPVITFDDGLTIHFNGEEIRMIHAEPGHTDTDSLIYFPKSNVLHMGDQFTNGKFPFVDLGQRRARAGHRAHGGARARGVPRRRQDHSRARRARRPRRPRALPAHDQGDDADGEGRNRVRQVARGDPEGGALGGVEGLGDRFPHPRLWIESVYQSLRQERQPSIRSPRSCAASSSHPAAAAATPSSATPAASAARSSADWWRR